jgi:hypothetical protein
VLWLSLALNASMSSSSRESVVNPDDNRVKKARLAAIARTPPSEDQNMLT